MDPTNHLTHVCALARGAAHWFSTMLTNPLDSVEMMTTFFAFVLVNGHRKTSVAHVGESL